jgi:hypothetical protein
MMVKKKEVSGTREWSSTSVNCMKGCSNGCLYCYACATAYTRTKQKDFGTWRDEEPIQKAVEKKYGKRDGTVMFPTQHDITEGNIDYTLPVFRKLVEARNKVLLVSKPRPHLIQKLCESLHGLSFPYKDNVLFRFTIGSMDPLILNTWEPNAPPFAERLYSLMWCFKNGWQTSVSMEPMLDERHPAVSRLVQTLSPYVTDAIWLGKANHLMQRLSVNFGGRDKIHPHIKLCAEALLESQSDGCIRTLYDSFNNSPKIKWKESIKKVVGLEVPTEAGLDI